LRAAAGARGIKPRREEIVCEVAEGTVHRLWEPLADKQRPRKRFCRQIRDALSARHRFVHGGVGLGAFTEICNQRRALTGAGAKVKFVIDPDNPYPNNYTGHIRARSATAAWWRSQPYARRRTGAADAPGRDRQVSLMRSMVAGAASRGCGVEADGGVV